MINKNKRVFVLSIIFLVLMVFTYNLFKTIKYQIDTKIDHSFFKKIVLNSIITNVAIARKTEVKILGVTEWIRIGGCKLELSQNQKDPKQYFLKGDSIIKKKNLTTFTIIRKF